jgi:hypothetical protein
MCWLNFLEGPVSGFTPIIFGECVA